MHHPNSVLETHSKDHGFKVRSCSTEERKKIAQRNLSIMHKSEEMRSHFSTQNFFLKSIDVVVNLFDQKDEACVARINLIAIYKLRGS